MTLNKNKHEKLVTLKSGVNVAIVADDAIVRLIESAIVPKDIAKLTNESLRNSQRKFQKLRENLGKPKRYKPTLREYCLAYPEYDPVYLAYRWIILETKR